MSFITETFHKISELPESTHILDDSYYSIVKLECMIEESLPKSDVEYVKRKLFGILRDVLTGYLTTSKKEMVIKFGEANYSQICDFCGFLQSHRYLKIVDGGFEITKKGSKLYNALSKSSLCEGEENS